LAAYASSADDAPDDEDDEARPGKFMSIVIYTNEYNDYE